MMADNNDDSNGLGNLCFDDDDDSDRLCFDIDKLWDIIDDDDTDILNFIQVPFLYHNYMYGYLCVCDLDPIALCVLYVEYS